MISSHALKQLAAEKMSAETNESSKVTPEKKSNTTLLVLLTILGLGVAGLIYDRRVARPSVEKAYDDVAELVVKTNRLVTESVNPEDVQATIGRAPINSFDDGDDYVEVFAWRSGLPIRTHKLYAVYREQHEQKVLYRHAKYKYESRSDVIAIPEAMIIQGDPTDLENLDGDMDGYAAQGGGAPSGGAGGPGGGRTMDPEARFAESDEDGDGKLTGDEISPRMQENLSETDTDGDGAVSKEEFMARMEVVAARFQGGGGREGGGGRAGGGGATDAGGYSSRPPGAPIIPRSDASAGDAENADADSASSTPKPEDSDSEDSDSEDSDSEDSDSDDAAPGEQP